MPDDPNPTKEKSAPLKTLASQKSGALHPQDSVETAGDRMRAHGAQEWPVAENRKLVGVVDDKNPDWKVAGHGHDPKTCLVGEIMSRKVMFCYEDEPCANARRLMEESKLQFLPVVDRQMRIVGIFSRDEVQDMSATSAVNKPIATQL